MYEYEWELRVIALLQIMMIKAMCDKKIDYEDIEIINTLKEELIHDLFDEDEDE